jgi:hypothetical protein
MSASSSTSAYGHHIEWSAIATGQCAISCQNTNMVHTRYGTFQPCCAVCSQQHLSRVMDRYKKTDFTTTALARLQSSGDLRVILCLCSSCWRWRGTSPSHCGCLSGYPQLHRYLWTYTVVHDETCRGMHYISWTFWALINCNSHIKNGFHGCDYEECRLLGYKSPVRTSQEAHYVSATEPSRLMLCKIEVFTVMTVNNVVFWDVTPCGSCKNRHFGGT